MNKKIWILGLILLFSGCAPTIKTVSVSKEEIEEEEKKQREIALFTYIERQERVTRIGYRLLKGATGLYKGQLKYLCGFEVHNKKMYKEEDIEILRKKYLIENQPTVKFVYPDSPAEKAGLLINDKILEIDGKKIKVPSDITEKIKKYKGEEGINFKVEREGEIVEIKIIPEKICPFTFSLITEDSINAWTDGQKIFVTTGLMRFIQSDEELALVLGHELAHAILNHVQKTMGNKILGTILDVIVIATTGIDTHGAFGTLGGLIFSKDFEREADYVGTYIVARAGYNISNAPDLWRRMAVEYPGSIKDKFLATHPSSPERYLLIEKTVKEIKEKQEKGLPLIPEEKK